MQVPNIRIFERQVFTTFNSDLRDNFLNSVCVFLDYNTEQPQGIGFFFQYNIYKYLITYLSVIYFMDEKICIELWNKRRIKF